MALLDLFNGNVPPVDREPTLRDSGQILAYFEQLQHLRTRVSLRLEEDSLVAYASRVEAVCEETGTFILSMQNRPSLEPKPRTPAFLWFTLDGLRFRARVRFLKRGAYMQSVFALPETILHAERRSQRRARFTARENVQVTALEGPFEGVGVNGLLVNLNTGGLRLRVDRAMDIRKDRLISLREDLFSPGTGLALVRLQGLPQTPLVEAAGCVRHCGFHGKSLVMGLSFESMGGMEVEAIARVLSQKLPGYSLAFPRKRRRGELESPAEDPDQEESPAPNDSDAELSDAALDDLRETIRSPDCIALLKKRSRQILLVMGDELERAVLLGNFYADGYRCLYEARGLVQALDIARRRNLDLLILHQQVGPHSALEILDQLRSSGRVGQAKVVVLKREDDVRLTVAAKAGGISLVIPGPPDFEGVLKPWIEQLVELSP